MVKYIPRRGTLIMGKPWIPGGIRLLHSQTLIHPPWGRYMDTCSSCWNPYTVLYVSGPIVVEMSIVSFIIVCRERRGEYCVVPYHDRQRAVSHS